MFEHTAQLPAPEPLQRAESPLVTPDPRRFESWFGWRGLAGALVTGLVLGGGIGAVVVATNTDPRQSEEYVSLQGELDAAHTQVSVSEKKAQVAAADARRMESEVAQRGTELDQREQSLTTQADAVAAREAAVTAVEQQIAANSIGEGTWTVGRDVAPGTYRTSAAVTGDCYWAITRSGTNGGSIIENDIVSGGFPTVQLGEGQDFTNNRCGTFVKQ